MVRTWHYQIVDTKDARGFTCNFGPLGVTWRSLFYARTRYFEHEGRLPLAERLSVMQETQEPWRKGHGAVVRLWPTRHAVILGWWGDPQVDDLAGEKRALQEVLAKNTQMAATGIPVSKLFPPLDAEGVAERIAASLPDDDPDGDVIIHEFAITDLRDESAV